MDWMNTRHDLEESETDHYKYPLCFPLWHEVGNSPQELCGRWANFFSSDSGCLCRFSFYLLWRASIG